MSKQRFRKHIGIPSGPIERLPFMQRTVAVSSSGVTGCTLNSPVTTLGKRTGSGETLLVGRDAATDAAVDTPMSAKYLFRASQPMVGNWWPLPADLLSITGRMHRYILFGPASSMRRSRQPRVSRCTALFTCRLSSLYTARSDPRSAARRDAISRFVSSLRGGGRWFLTRTRLTGACIHRVSRLAATAVNVDVNISGGFMISCLGVKIAQLSFFE